LVDLSLQSGYFLDSSVLSKYVVRRVSGSQVEVWKDGALLQTITIGGASQDIQTVGISADGQYIGIADEANNTLYLYEGS
jgi:uncharacterized protein YjiK